MLKLRLPGLSRKPADDPSGDPVGDPPGDPSGDPVRDPGGDPKDGIGVATGGGASASVSSETSAVMGAGAVAGVTSGAATTAGRDEDARILRRTRLRLMALSGGVTLVILVLLGVAAYTAVATSLDTSGQAKVQDRVASLRGVLVDNLDPRRLALALGGRQAGTWAYLVPPAGETIGPPDQLAPTGLPDEGSIALARKGHPNTQIVRVGDASYRVYSESYACTSGTCVIQAVADRTSEASLLDTLFRVLLLGGLGALLAALAAGYFYAGRALVPIRQSIARRQAALQRQREFTANASHELRTPLTVIRASVTDLMRNRRARVEDVGEALEDIDAEVAHLTALVDDLLLLARTDAGVIQIEHVPLDLADVAVEAASVLGPLGQAKSVGVVLDPLPAPLIGDPLRLRQLVTILVDNAIRHSPAGTTVVLRVRPDSGGAILGVEDDGAGIKPENLTRLFERFWRADDAPAGGTGLGLAIAKWIVEQHGGSIGAANRPEGGARFWVRLPGNGLPAQSADAAAGQRAGSASRPGTDAGTPHAGPDGSAPAGMESTEPYDLPLEPLGSPSLRWSPSDRPEARSNGHEDGAARVDTSPGSNRL